MKNQSSTLTQEFVAAMRGNQPLLTAESDYIQQFWRPYLGASAFALWQVLAGVQGMINGRIYERWPTIEVLSSMVGEGDRYTILGRAATATRPAQVGALDKLVEENLVVGWLKGEGKGRRYTFEVQVEIPVLTPRQAKQLDTAVWKLHKRYLTRLGILSQWEKLLHKTLVHPPGTIR